MRLTLPQVMSPRIIPTALDRRLTCLPRARAGVIPAMIPRGFARVSLAWSLSRACGQKQRALTSVHLPIETAVDD